MKKRKKPQQKILLWLLLAACIIVAIVLMQPPKTSVKAAQASVAKKKITMYPRQYSDMHGRESAMETDKQFRDITLVDKQSLLGNVISSVIGGSQSTGPENGTWLWTPLMQITPPYRDFIIAGAKQNGVKTIYLSLDSYLDIFVMQNGSDRDKAREKFDMALSDFVSAANNAGITVDAEGGWQNWAEPGNEYKAEALIDFVIRFNKNHTEKIRGFQYDVESYLVPNYPANKSTVLYNLVYLVDKTVAKLSGTDLKFSVVIPDFYDGVSGETPEFSYRGEMGYTLDHLLRVLGRREGSQLIEMSYRNISRGDDGSIDISKDEIEKANQTNTKVVIAQETGDVLPQYITFWNTTRPYYEKQITAIEDEFSGEKSFGGIATHYINSYLELK